MWLSLFMWLVVLVAAAACAAASTPPLEPGNHTNNWVVLVDTSRFWFNYRHAGNVFSLYRIVRRLGVPDSHIILMVADGMACEAQNPFPAQLFSDEQRTKNVYGSEAEVDYRGTEVTAEALMRVLTGRHAPEVPPSKRLLSDADSNVLLYLTGHGGDEFFKFQDAGEISSFDLADAFHSMREKGRYRELLAVADTCQANTLQERLRSPGVAMVGSSRRSENSWSKGANAALGTTMADRFTDATLEFVERRFPPGRAAPQPEPSLLEWLRAMDPSALASHPGWVSRLSRPLDRVPLADLFAARPRRAVLAPSPPGPLPPPRSCRPRMRSTPPNALPLAEEPQRRAELPQWLVLAVSSLALAAAFLL